MRKRSSWIIAVQQMFDATTSDLNRRRDSSTREGLGFPGGAVVENPPANAGDTGSSPGLGRYHMPRSN